MRSFSCPHFVIVHGENSHQLELPQPTKDKKVHDTLKTQMVAVVIGTEILTVWLIRSALIIIQEVS